MLDNKNIFIVGGLGLIGRSFSKSVIENGAELIIGDIETKENIQRFNDLKKDFIDKGLVKFEHHTFPLDLAALNAEIIVRCQSNNEKKFEIISETPK